MVTGVNSKNVNICGEFVGVDNEIGSTLFVGQRLGDGWTEAIADELVIGRFIERTGMGLRFVIPSERKWYIRLNNVVPKRERSAKFRVYVLIDNVAEYICDSQSFRLLPKPRVVKEVIDDDQSSKESVSPEQEQVAVAESNIDQSQAELGNAIRSAPTRFENEEKVLKLEGTEGEDDFKKLLDIMFPENPD